VVRKYRYLFICYVTVCLYTVVSEERGKEKRI